MADGRCHLEPDPIPSLITLKILWILPHLLRMFLLDLVIDDVGHGKGRDDTEEIFSETSNRVRDPFHHNPSKGSLFEGGEGVGDEPTDRRHRTEMMTSHSITKETISALGIRINEGEI